jgi:hypothetical protein
MKLLHHLFFSAIAIASLSSCMRSASMTVLQPAKFTVPEHIAKLAVVDRSKPSNGWLNVLEGVLTGEAIGQDRRSREEAVDGLTEGLRNTPRFQVIRTGIEMTGSKAGSNMPQPLPWSEIERVCRENHADAVVAIESFDTDNNVSTVRRESKSKNAKTGKETITVTYHSDMRSSVRMGWRMYDPQSKIIIDEYTTDDFTVSDGSGSTEREAVNRLPSQTSVTRQVANIGGEHYGMRIAPTYVQVSRAYYAKAKGHKTEMKQADRFAKAGSWDKAAEQWKRIYESNLTNKKVAGRTAYNMAVAAELSGNAILAQEWAKISWEKHGNKKAREYIYTLENRMNDQRKANQQMHKKA